MNRQDRIEAFRTGADVVAAAWEAVPDGARMFRPAEGEWSPHELVLHMVDADVNGYLRFRKLVAEPGATVAGYAQDDWARDLGYHDRDADLGIELMRLLRATTHPILESLPESVWDHTVTHSERGTWSMDDWLRTYTDHVTNHLDQMEETLDTWRGRERP